MVEGIRIDAHDLAEMRRLIERLNLYRSGAIALGGLIADVETILAGLETDDAELHGRLREKWGAMEQIYAFALAMREGEFDNEAKREIRAAVDDLQRTVTGIIAVNE